MKALRSSGRDVTLCAAVLLGICSGTPEASTFGVDAHIPSTQVADEISAAGIGWTRIDVVWALIEPEQDRYEWGLYDELLDRLESRGLRIFATVSGTPQWATAGSEFGGAPGDPADWRDFCYVLASRYAHRIDTWGFWNEPNLVHFWEGSRQQYLDEILRPGIEAVRTVDPEAMVAGPDLAHLSSADWDDWLGDIVSRTRDLLDVVTHHAYPSDGSSADVGEKLNEGGQFPWDPPSVRSVLDDAGWIQRPVWLTETGVESDEYGEVGQETFYRELLEDWFGVERSHSWLGRIFFYEMADPGTDPAFSFGILEGPPAHIRKLAFYAYQGFISSAIVDDAEVVIHGVPAIMGSRESVEVQIEVRNTGTSTWTVDDGHYLIFDVEDFGWTASVEPVAVTGPVEPGGTQLLNGRLASSLIQPHQPNRTVGVYARMVRIGGPRFGDAVWRAVTHTPHTPPVILGGPAQTSSPFNGSATFTVDAMSDSEITYQWRRHTVDLADNHRRSGSQGPELTLNAIGWADLGDYDCVITNAAGRVITGPARLTMTGAPIHRPSGRIGAGATGAVARWIQFQMRGRSLHGHRGRPASVELSR